MKQKQSPRFGISFRLYLYIVLLIALSVLATGTLLIHEALSIKSEDQDTVIRDMAAMISTMKETRETLREGEIDPLFQQELDTLTQTLSMVDVIVICNTESVRFYHTDQERVGETFIGGDEGDILAGADPYISVSTGTLGKQRRAFHSITDEEGNILGFCMVSALQERIDLIQGRVLRNLLTLSLGILGAGLLGAVIFSKALKGILLGYKPEELVNLYIEREEVLNTMEEGLLAIDTAGQITLMNTSAKRMFDIPADTPLEGHPLAEVYPDSRLPDTMESGLTEHDISSVIHKKNILTSRIPIQRAGKTIGAVSVLRNKTELTRLAEELTGARYMVDTLRAVNHEFMNKLHIILGHLEMGNVQDAKDFILNTSLVSGTAVSDIHERVPIPSLAALLIGKLLRANELGITFLLKQDSYFFPKQIDLPPDCYVTLVGNLVENALDELNSKDYPVKQIELGVYSEEGHTTIVCDDTGGGIPEQILFGIYNVHTTTKGPGHGNGYFLMKQIVDRYEGTFHIDTEPGEGSSIEINLPI